MTIYIFLLMFIFFSAGNLQEVKSNQPNFGEQKRMWPSHIHTAQGNYYGGTRKMQAKPCARRQNSPGENAEQWIPTFNSRIIKPFQNNNIVLRPHSLTNGDFPTDANIKPEVTKNQDLSNRVSSDYYDFLAIKERNNLSANEAVGDCDPLIDQRDPIDVFLPDNNETGETKANFETDNGYVKSGSIKCFNKNELVTTEHSFRDSRRFLSNSDDLSKENRDNDALTLNNTNILNENLPKLISPIGEEDTKNFNSLRQNGLDLTNHGKKVTGLRSLLKLVNNNQLVDPTKGVGIVNITESRAILLESPRVCYACSTATNPTCWKPDKRTTVKYCSKGHDACVTKTIKTKSLVLIRDCGKTCDDTGFIGHELKFESCSVCHSDLCNSGRSINNNYYLLYVIFFIMLIKHTILLH